MKDIILGLIILVIIAVLFQKKLKTLKFKIPFFEASIETHSNLPSINTGGGRGGDAKTSGFNSRAIGGKGGGGGPRGKGGDGGHAEALGDNSFAMGGEGGEAGQIDRGGKGGRGPLHALLEDHPDEAKDIFEKFGITEEMAKTIGKGGDGASPLMR